MPRRDAGGDSRRCGACGANNYSFASFCIACGEPFDDGGEQVLLESEAIARPHTGKAERARQIDRPHVSGLGRRETAIGVALLLLAIGFAIYQWHRSDEQNSAYKEGLSAERSKDWNKAADAFARAGDHIGAGDKAREARGMVAQRDQLYLDGITAQDRKDWKSAATSFEGVLKIQPSYQDAAHRLDVARGQGSMLEMGGLIYRVAGPPGEGLYYMDGVGHTIPLPGSDGRSQVRAISRPGTRLVYDRPGSYAFARAAGGYLHLSSGADKREVVVASIGLGKIRATPLPGLDPSGSGVFNSSGLWWIEGEQGKEDIWYVDTLPRSPEPVHISGSPGDRRVLAFDPPRGRIVWGTASGGSTGGQNQTVLSITDAQGKMTWLVGTLTGNVESAAVSRDSRWLLAVTWQAKPGGIYERTVWAQSLGVTWDPEYGQVLGTPVKLASVDVPAGSKNHISATFLPSDAMPARVALDTIKGGVESMTIYSLDSAGANQVWYGRPSTPEQEDRASFTNGGELMASPRRYSDGALLELFDLSRSDFKRWFNVPLPLGHDTTVQTSFAPRRNYIVVTVQNYRGLDGHQSQSVYTARVGADGSLYPARLLATALLNGSPTVAPAPGGSLLSYVSKRGELRVVHYDGTGDAPVAHGVSAIWTLGVDTDLGWSR